MLEAQGVHRRSEKQVLLIVVNDQEFADIKQLIESIDPQAFVIASNVAEVFEDEGLVTTRLNEACPHPFEALHDVVGWFYSFILTGF